MAWRLTRLLLVLVLSAVAAEATVRAAAWLDPSIRVLARPYPVREQEPASFDELRASRPDAIVPHVELFGYWRNAHGFYDREIEPSSTDAFRVVALGDSFAFGSVSYPRAYLTVVEGATALLTGRVSGHGRLAVENLGIPGTGIEDYLRVWQLLGRSLHPDLVLVTIYLGNDLYDFADARGLGRLVRSPSWLVTFLRRALAVSRESPGRVGHLGASPTADGQAVPIGGKPYGFPPLMRDDRPPLSEKRMADADHDNAIDVELEALWREGSPRDVVEIDGFLQALDALADAIALDGAPIALVLAPSQLQVDPAELERALRRLGASRDDLDLERPNRVVAQWARQRGIPAFDLTPLLRARSREGVRVYRPNDTHWNLAGNDVAALEVARWLADSGLVPARPTTPAVARAGAAR